jgi:HD-GYP domain-containing protein (c-di-GMP phosphodiesterase class II)
MTTTRSYRKGMSVDVAVAELTANSGTQFDPRVVTALLEVLERPSPGPPVALPQSDAGVEPVFTASPAARTESR